MKQSGPRARGLSPNPIYGKLASVCAQGKGTLEVIHVGSRMELRVVNRGKKLSSLATTFDPRKPDEAAYLLLVKMKVS